ncbi:MAG TPA: hypothetical protein VL854_11965 [Nitrososphaeraceae archaeon]|nr:hypothetical protein [Nitrososphaeraceae archaeon]
MTTQEELRSILNSMCDRVSEHLPEGWTFAIIMLQTHEGREREGVQPSRYAANFPREDGIKALKEILFRWGHEEDWMKEIK